MRQRLPILLLSLILAFLAGSGGLYAQDTKAQETKRARLQKEIAILDSQIKAITTKSANAINHLSLIRKKVDARKELVAESDREISGLTKAISAKEKDIKAMQARLDTLSDYYERLVRGAYKNRNPKVWYMYILASDNVGQAFRRYGYLRDLSKQMNIQAERIIAAKDTLEREREALAVLKKDAETLRSQRLADMGKLQAEQNDSQKLVNQLKRDKKKYQQDLSKKQKEVEALNREIQRIISQALNEKGGSKGSGKSSSTKEAPKPIDYTLAKKFEANKGKLPWPAEGAVVEHYGQRYDPVYPNLKLPFNNGISIALGQGSSIKAVFDGEVKQVVVMPGYNKCVLVQHGNFFSFYCKMGNVSVKKGDKVKTGQSLGTVDTIGGETQLHFQIWSGKTPQNPETWLRPR
ncbi:MAG: peptidoglycan DD-metalloendopeptidase family protein [Bacteroidales bacterium]|nr:peptidoglycan DD-metalloendopeptidase family protein [Bacteroidales bacterium]